jgi:large subunit ribosomal protein L25
MDKIVLQAEKRTDAGLRHVLRELRTAGRVPAVVYGKGIETEMVAVNSRELHKAMVAAGAGLISLEIGGGAPVQVLAREIQRHPVKRNALHVDFMAVSMTELMQLEVPIVIEGTAPILARPDIVMVRNMDSVEIECLPTDIPQHLVANISNLKGEDDSVCVSDLVMPAGVRAVTDPSHVVISLSISRVSAEDEAAEAAEATAADQVEVVGKGKKEEEEEE